MFVNNDYYNSNGSITRIRFNSETLIIAFQNGSLESGRERYGRGPIFRPLQ